MNYLIITIFKNRETGEELDRCTYYMDKELLDLHADLLAIDNQIPRKQIEIIREKKEHQPPDFTEALLNFPHTGRSLGPLKKWHIKQVRPDFKKGILPDDLKTIKKTQSTGPQTIRVWKAPGGPGKYCTVTDTGELIQYYETLAAVRKHYRTDIKNGSIKLQRELQNVYRSAEDPGEGKT